MTKSFYEEMLGKFTTGELKPIIDDVLSMSDIQAAHRRMDANETFGKLVLAW
ncbi:MAG: zinc-binding dehydrogenase [Polyangiales bacterium]